MNYKIERFFLLIWKLATSGFRSFFLGIFGDVTDNEISDRIEYFFALSNWSLYVLGSTTSSPIFFIRIQFKMKLNLFEIEKGSNYHLQLCIYIPRKRLIEAPFTHGWHKKLISIL